MISQARPYQSDIESITEFGCMRSLKADTGVYPFDAKLCCVLSRLYAMDRPMDHGIRDHAHMT